MKRLTAPWTTILTTAALLALPVAGGAQTPQSQTPPEPQPERSTTLSTPTHQNAPAAEHLRQAKDALANIDANTVPADAKSQLASLRRHISALERSVAANDSASETGAAQRSSKATDKPRGRTNWANDVAAIDRIVTQLAGDGSAAMTGAGDPGTVGTSGTEHKSNKAKSGTMKLDEPARSRLLEVRTHITAFAAAMSGTSSPSSSPASSSQQRPETGTQPEGSAPQSSAAGTTGTTSSAAGHAGAGQTGSTPANQPPTPTGQAGTSETGSPATGTAGQTSGTTATSGQTTGQTASASSSQPGSTMTGGTEASAQAHVDAETAKLHLTAARDSLTQLTQLPAAAQLQGDARTQVAQLIQNFNELITTEENWRAAYEKVDGNVTALIGPAPPQASSAPEATAPPAQTPEEAAANPAPPAAQPTDPGTAPPATEPANPPAGTQPGTSGAVGTSGTSGQATLDPAIRQKLVEFRKHLQAFHRAAGGEQQ